MYPLISWNYSKLCRRLDKLIKYELYNESVIASSQTIEQILRRILKQYMTKLRKAYDFNSKTYLNSTSASERDYYLKCYSNITQIKRAWNKILRDQYNILGLPIVIQNILGDNTWSILTKNTHVYIQDEIKSDTIECKYGLLPLRHLLVHGTVSPPKHEIEVLGQWGIKSVKKLLHPDNGVCFYVNWNPQSRIKRFQMSH